MKRRIGIAGTLLLVSSVFVGCASSDMVEEPTPTTAPTEQVEEAPMLELPEGARAEGVVLAALVLSSGDVTRAVEEGLVTPEEVDIALKALEDGTLQNWVDLAEADPQ